MSDQDSVIDQRALLMRRHWQRPQSREHLHAEKRSTVRPTIAISRQAGAPGGQIAREIGAKLDWPVYDREIIEVIAEQSGLRSELLESVDEHDPNWLVESLSSFGRRGELTSAGYVHRLARVLAALHAHGGCVIVGRGANVVLPAQGTLRVRVVADLQDRIARTADQGKISRAEARERVERIDRDRARFVQNHFHRDVNDVRWLDLTLNASRFNVEQCAALAMGALRYLEATPAFQIRCDS